MADTCIVHLVRAANGLEPFQRFIQSYRNHPAGIEHELLVIFKGFDLEIQPEEYVEVLAGLSYKTFHLADEGFDIRAYFLAARQFPAGHYCFLNSFSKILDDHWLAKMYRHIICAGVGLVGATGSYESIYSQQLGQWSGSSVRRSLSPRSLVAGNLRHRRELAPWKALFDPFPNYHVRTNAFILAREVLLRLKDWDAATKMDAYAFESGKNGLTRQVVAMGLRALVVGRDGKGYERERWHESRTFRSGKQSNLLVGDNQTADYQEAEAEKRMRLARLAWGDGIETSASG